MGKLYDATWGRGFAAVYDRAFEATEEAGLREMRRELLAGASGRTGDVGAGTSANIGFFPPAVTELLFAEPDPHMVKRLRAKLSGVEGEGLQAPAERLPLEDSSIDTVAFTLVLCTVPNPTPALAAAAISLRAPAPSSPTAATATATRWRRLKHQPLRSRRSRRDRCQKRRRSSGPWSGAAPLASARAGQITTTNCSTRCSRDGMPA